jgi:adenine phosphoribosyltransferase
MSPWAGSFEDHVRDIPDWPRPGVAFKDITPLLADAAAFAGAVDAIAGAFEGRVVDKVLGIEARGFIFAAPVAYRFGAGFVPVRKAGKLPWEIERQEYALEYGTDLLEIHRDAVRPGEQVLVIDDVLATGGTAAATARLVERLGGEIVGFAFLIELGFLDGRRLLDGIEVTSLVSYDGTEQASPPAAAAVTTASGPAARPMTGEVR